MEKETEELLNLLELGNKEIEEGKFQTAEEFFNEMDKENQEKNDS